MENIEEFLKNESRRQRAYLWGKYIVFEPKIISKIFGDGKQVIYYGTIDCRPRFWIIRIDSLTNIESDDFNWEHISDAISDDFGEVSDDDRVPYPAIKNTMGCYWGLLRNFGADTRLTQ